MHLLSPAGMGGIMKGKGREEGEEGDEKVFNVCVCCVVLCCVF